MRLFGWAMPAAVMVALLVVALPLASFLAAYLAGFGVPPVPRVLIGLLVVPSIVVVGMLLVPSLVAWRLRRRFARFSGDWQSAGPPDDTDLEALAAIGPMRRKWTPDRSGPSSEWARRGSRPA